MSEQRAWSAEDARLLEALDAALHEWWNDDHGEGSGHACRPVPTEDEFLIAATRHGITIALAAPSRGPDDYERGFKAGWDAAAAMDELAEQTLARGPDHSDGCAGNCGTNDSDNPPCPAQDHARQSRAGTHLYDESCPFCVGPSRGKTPPADVSGPDLDPLDIDAMAQALELRDVQRGGSPHITPGNTFYREEAAALLACLPPSRGRTGPKEQPGPDLLRDVRRDVEMLTAYHPHEAPYIGGDPSLPCIRSQCAGGMRLAILAIIDTALDKDSGR